MAIPSVSDAPEPPCICWEKGCEHLMSWHRLVATDRAVCDVPGCFCYTSVVCDHMQAAGSDNTAEDRAILHELGIGE